MYIFKSTIQLFLICSLLLISACNDNSNTGTKAVKATVPVKSEQATKILYITSVGWFHDYQQQIKTISSNINQYMNADIDVIVGDIERLKTTDFSNGYDLLIYNFCHAAQRDNELLQSLMSPVVNEGKPLIALHCAMHSFQYSPDWATFLGLKTLRHEQQRSFAVEKVGNHKLIADLAETWTLSSDELYITISQDEGIVPLLQSYGIETKKQHTQAWLYQSGKGKVIGTTLGHNEQTLTDSNFQQFIANSIRFLVIKEPEVAPETGYNISLNILTEGVNYPDDQEKKCVIHNMFSIGGEKVKSCVASQCTDTSTLAQCTAQCKQDNPWAVPKQLREACQSNELTAPN